MDTVEVGEGGGKGGRGLGPAIRRGGEGGLCGRRRTEG